MAVSSVFDATIAAAATRAPLGIVIRDADNEVIFQNEAALGYTAPTTDLAVLGLRIRELLDEASGFDESIEQEIDLYHPRPRSLYLQAAPLFGETGRIGTAAFIEDRTTRSQIDSIRSDFIANASHELKTPLGAMQLLSEALVATDEPEAISDLAAKIAGEAGRMNRLVEDILDLAIIEGTQLESGNLELCEVVAEAVAKSDVLAETLGIPVQQTCAPVAVAGDHRQLVSAIANLIDNALSYTAIKGVDTPDAVEVRVHPDNGRAVIEIEDHGIGIPERHQDRIFERFYRVDRGRSRASGGTGLGLAIVNHVVHNHDGKITVHSVSGEGSTFRIDLPALGG